MELEGQLENILSKCLGLEKIKSHLQAELDSTAAEVEKVGGLMGGIGGWLVGGTGGVLGGGGELGVGMMGGNVGVKE